MKDNNNFLCESYRDFVFIFDKGTNVYFLSNDPSEKDFNADEIDLSKFTQKDNLESVIDTVDEYYDTTLEEDVDSEIEESIFIVKVKKLNGDYDTVEFDDINNAQRYIDTFKIEGSHEYTEAHFLDEVGNELDAWIGEDKEAVEDILPEQNESLNEDAEEDAKADKGLGIKDNGKMSDTFNKLPYLKELKDDCYILLNNNDSDLKNYISKDYDDFEIKDRKEPTYLKNGKFIAGTSNTPKKDEDRLYVEITANPNTNSLKFYFQVNILFEDENTEPKRIPFEYNIKMLEFINEFSSYQWKDLFKQLADEVAKRLNLKDNKKKLFFRDFDNFLQYLIVKIRSLKPESFKADLINSLFKNGDSDTLAELKLKERFNRFINNADSLRLSSFNDDILTEIDSNDPDGTKITNIEEIIIKYLSEFTK